MKFAPTFPGRERRQARLVGASQKTHHVWASSGKQDIAVCMNCGEERAAGQAVGYNFAISVARELRRPFPLDCDPSIERRERFKTKPRKRKGKGEQTEAVGLTPRPQRPSDPSLTQ